MDDASDAICMVFILVPLAELEESKGAPDWDNRAFDSDTSALLWEDTEEHGPRFRLRFLGSGIASRYTFRRWFNFCVTSGEVLYFE
jgi:hypothetical protein